jgi:hypothetical protein
MAYILRHGLDQSNPSEKAPFQPTYIYRFTRTVFHQGRRIPPPEENGAPA